MGVRPNAPMIGTRLAHYLIVERVGKGGMGVVYRARGEHLERDVAIKILPAETLAVEYARRQFRKEALALPSSIIPTSRSCMISIRGMAWTPWF